jgi:hypothetical protein
MRDDGASVVLAMQVAERAGGVGAVPTGRGGTAGDERVLNVPAAGLEGWDLGRLGAGRRDALVGGGTCWDDGGGGRLRRRLLAEIGGGDRAGCGGPRGRRGETLRCLGGRASTDGRRRWRADVGVGVGLVGAAADVILLIVARGVGLVVEDDAALLRARNTRAMDDA